MLILDLREHQEAGSARSSATRLGFADDELKTHAADAGLRDVRVGVGARKAGDPFTVLIASGVEAGGDPRRLANEQDDA